MSESSDYMELSPSKFDQVSACAKLRDTVTGISALHLSIHGMDGRSPSPGNSFMDMYISGKQAMIRRKAEMVSELQTLPPCTISDCQDHKIPSTSVEEENNFVPSPPVIENKIENKTKINSKSKKKFSKKRKQKGKDSTEEFIFPKKTARPISPTSTQDPIETNNSFSDLEQDVEHPPSIETVTTEVVTPKIPPPHPIMLKIKDNFREQIKCISEKFPNLRNRIVNDVVKMFSTDHEEYRKLKHFLETDKDFEFYILKRQKDKPIKAVIKGLPNSALITDITNDLKLIGFNIDSCTQLISKRTKKSLPYFLITLPRNDLNSKIFDIKKLGYLQVKVEGYLVRGITQCFNCNNFYHTAANCFMKPRCLKCGKDHATRNCHIKERQENPFCINCQDFGHSACYTKCPKFPQPKKGAAFSDPIKRKIFQANGLKREFPSLTLLAEKSPIRSPPKPKT
ncbi:nucleic-acid-binding protein from transposon X-element [Trichonephila clavipes]|nr:nucleic-acid-binding protein from transposon X-element [Trichonephila clavipes]